MTAKGGPGGRWLWYLYGALGALGLAWLLFHLFPGALQGDDDNRRLVYLVALLALVGGGSLGGIARRGAPGVLRAAGQLGIWIGIAVALLLGYSYRAEVSDAGRRISALLLPAQGQAVDGQTMCFTLEADRQFHVKAMVGGMPVYFLVDTGASDVLLSQADARRVGIDPGSLSYTQLYRTASGTARGAAVTLPEIDIGTIHLTDVNASVSESYTEGSLLGMSFLGRLSSYEVDGDTLTLRQ
jgi:aspartyl protease family protein